MNLTPQQLATLAADIAADPVLSTKPRTSDGAFEVAAAYNLKASPDLYVRRSKVSAQEWRAAIVGGGGATQLDSLSASKRESLFWAVSDTLVVVSRETCTGCVKCIAPCPVGALRMVDA